MTNLIKKIILPCLLIIMLGGCTSYKKIAYMQNIQEGYNETIHNQYEIKFHTDDVISIIVSSKDPELAVMFNQPMVSYQFRNNESGTGASQQRLVGYMIDERGYIDFPQLGKIKIAGMTRWELTDYIKNELKSKGLLNDPIVTVQFLNFKISVMGEVSRPGSFDITSDRITILDAISKAGDLTIYGKRENIKVIREQNGIRTVAMVNLLDGEIFNSPYYYLQQNDIIYVEPNKAKAGQREINQNRTIGTFASIISVFLSVATLVFK